MCLYPVLIFLVSVYIGVVSAALFGQAYRTGVEKLSGVSTVAIQAVKTPSPRKSSGTVSKPKPKSRKPAVKKSV
jgi:predicted homoserine dehydrogenase-like protein